MNQKLECIVKLIYIDILNGTFVTEGFKSIDSLVSNSKEVLNDVTDEDIKSMYSSGDWRDSITASWIVGIGYFNKFLEVIKERIICANNCYEAQYHFFALARIDDYKSAFRHYHKISQFVFTCA